MQASWWRWGRGEGGYVAVISISAGTRRTAVVMPCVRLTSKPTAKGGGEDVHTTAGDEGGVDPK
jgi:hypothetical protein